MSDQIQFGQNRLSALDSLNELLDSRHGIIKSARFQAFLDC